MVTLRTLTGMRAFLRTPLAAIIGTCLALLAFYLMNTILLDAHVLPSICSGPNVSASSVRIADITAWSGLESAGIIACVALGVIVYQSLHRVRDALDDFDDEKAK